MDYQSKASVSGLFAESGVEAALKQCFATGCSDVIIAAAHGNPFPDSILLYLNLVY